MAAALANASKRQLTQALHAIGLQEIMSTAGENPVAVFGHGSNNVEQLRARLHIPDLVALPAFVSNYERVFGGPNNSWSVGGRLGKVSTASLRPNVSNGVRTFGSCVLLSPEYLARLDEFEGIAAGVYEHTVVTVVLCSGSQQSPPFPAITYTRTDHSQYTGGGPTEAYLCAIKRNLQQSFQAADVTVTIRDGSGVAHAEWQHPGFGNLSLPAFIYEVGVRKRRPWEMPRTIDEVVDKLEAVGVPMSTTPKQLCESLEEVNARLIAANRLPFSDEVRQIIKRLTMLDAYTLE